jgi:phospholipid transport system substrate-binding protein
MTMAIRAILTGALLLSAGAAVSAGPPTEQVRQYSDHVQRILEDASIEQADKRAAVRRVAEQVFDVNETARRALGPHWQRRTPSEQEEFVQVFAELIERTYMGKLDLYGGERLQYTGESVDGGYATVRAKVVTKQGVEVPVEARMHRRGDKWLIYDIAIENVSLVGNYRSQFDRIIRSSSFAELMRRLKVRRDEFLPPPREARPAPS